MEDNQKKVPAKRIHIVDVVLERKGTQLFEGRRIRSPHDAFEVMKDFIGSPDKEIFGILCVDTKNQPTHISEISRGNINSSIVHPREVMKPAILSSSSSILLFHNHPSNDVTPSPEDIEVTKRLVEVGYILGIEVLDHLILGSNHFCSLKEKGYI